MSVIFSIYFVYFPLYTPLYRRVEGRQFPNMLHTPPEEILNTDSLYMDMVSFTVADFMEKNPDCRECEYRCLCCCGCRAIAVRDHPTEYLSKDLTKCEYYKGGWKDKKDTLLRRIGVLN